MFTTVSSAASKRLPDTSYNRREKQAIASRNNWITFEIHLQDPELVMDKGSTSRVQD